MTQSLLNIELDTVNRSRYLNAAIAAARRAVIHGTGFALDDFEDDPAHGWVMFQVTFWNDFHEGHEGYWSSTAVIEYEYLEAPDIATRKLTECGAWFASGKVNEASDKADDAPVWSDQCQD